jgi:hypothetical protein
MARITMLIGRHGKAPQKPEGGSYDELVPEAIPEIYKDTGLPLQAIVQEHGITQETSFLVHTNKIRTLYTGQAIVVGAFDMQPSNGTNPPQSQEDLANYDFSKVDTAEDPRFKISTPNINLPIYKEFGTDPCMNYWLANPEATEHEGVPIETYVSLSSRSNEGIKDNIERLISYPKDLGIIVSHGTVIEAPIVTLIDSGRTTPIEKMEDIGGSFEMAEFATLTIDQTKGGLYTATLEYKGQKHNVDLRKIL